MGLYTGAASPALGTRAARQFTIYKYRVSSVAVDGVVVLLNASVIDRWTERDVRRAFRAAGPWPGNRSPLCRLSVGSE